MAREEEAEEEEEEEEKEEGSSLCAGLPREGRQAARQGECRASACSCANTNAAKANFTEFHSADSSLSQDSSASEISSLEMEKKKVF